MKILWIVNMLLPEAAEYLKTDTGSSGTWMIDISKRLAQTENVNLAVACVYGSEFKKFDYKGITYYLLPGNGKNMLFYTKRFEKLWKKINDEFKPDIVHLHGTEYSHGLAFLRACENVPAVVSLQGMLNRIKDVDFGGISKKELFFNRTLKQNLKFNGELEMHAIHKKNAKHEREILTRAKYINGVNTWDTSLAKSINPDLKVFKLEYNLREGFYDAEKWDLDFAEKYTIFTNPGGTPLKGLHKLIEAVAIVKRTYPNVKLYVPGMSRGDGKLLVNGAYSKYVNKLIKKLNLTENVVFLGRLNERQMIESMQKAHAVVIPSAIEGVSLILREAMYLGCPCVASFRGGMADFISDKNDGFLYDFQETPYLAERINELFSNDDLCRKFSENAIKKTLVAHDREKNLKEYLNMYNQIYTAKER